MVPPVPYTKGMNKQTLPQHMQDRYEIRDGFIIKKGETDPIIFAAMESMKAQMAAETARRERIRQGLEPAGQWGEWHISDRH